MGADGLPLGGGRTTATRELLQDALLEDPTYLQFSVFVHELGLLRHIRQAMAKMARSAKRLLEDQRFKAIFDPTMKTMRLPLKGINLALPTATELGGVFRTEFLPPIVEPVALWHGLPSGRVRF